VRRLLLALLLLAAAPVATAVPYRPPPPTTPEAHELAWRKPSAARRLWSPSPSELLDARFVREDGLLSRNLVEGLERRGSLALLRTRYPTATAFYAALLGHRPATSSEAEQDTYWTLRAAYLYAFGPDHAGSPGTELWVLGPGGRLLLRRDEPFFRPHHLRPPEVAVAGVRPPRRR
jgi:hypothetical protein